MALAISLNVFHLVSYLCDINMDEQDIQDRGS